MRTSDFDYPLPETCIAQTPLEPRDSSRLLVLHRRTGKVEHRIFHEIGDYLDPGDLLVLNQTRVIPARIYARKPTGGKVELLLLARRDALIWECLVGGKGVRVSSILQVQPGLQAEILEILNGSQRLVRFSEPIEPHFPEVGHVPLPPYIHTALEDPERYQTVYAREPGSAAAPTAGLHFTARLLEALQARGVRVASVTLHVGLDTFAPVTEEFPEEHRIHTEWCHLPGGTAEAVNETRAAGGRIIAVGTTSVRTLESAGIRIRERGGVADSQSPNTRDGRSPPVVREFDGPTSLFILPGYEFKLVDAMITNFHLPRSTLIMMVSAFAGREKILDTYETAIREGYRFYSFGDAMLIL
jgi:S-adenosylmethionine:tRNA ribosyltransferase-isomerase